MSRYLAVADFGDGPSFKVCDTRAEALTQGEGSERIEIARFDGELLAIGCTSYGDLTVNGQQCTVYIRLGQTVEVDEE